MSSLAALHWLVNTWKLVPSVARLVTESRATSVHLHNTLMQPMHVTRTRTTLVLL